VRELYFVACGCKDILKINRFVQGRIQPVRLGGAISAIFGSEVSLRVHYCRKDEVYFTTLL